MPRQTSRKTLLYTGTYVALAMAVYGCATRSQVAKLETTSLDHDRRITSIESGLKDDRQQLRNELENAKTQIAELETVLKQATAIVTRNSADLGADVQQLKDQLAALEGKIAENRNAAASPMREIELLRSETSDKLQQLAKRAGVDAPVNLGAIPDDPNEHFATAYRSYQRKAYVQARGLFRVFIERHTDHAQADNAQYWIGTSFLAENKPARALGELRKVIAVYPEGDAADESLFDMAEAFWRLKACSDAKTALKALIQRHPKSPLTSRGRTKLKKISRAKKNRCNS